MTRAPRPAIGLPLAEVAAADLAISAGCGTLGFALARALRPPAAEVVGPMILSGAVHLTGWTSAKPPFELVAAAQVVIGTAIGCRFAGVSTRLLSRSIVAAADAALVATHHVVRIFLIVVFAPLAFPIMKRRRRDTTADRSA